MNRLLALMLLALTVLFACDHESSGVVSPRPPASTVAPAPDAPASMPDAAVVAAPTSDASVAKEGDAATASPTPPTKVERSGKIWPFCAWNRAEAILFNQFSMRPNTPIVAYDDVTGFSPHIVKRKFLDEAKAKGAVALVMETNGDVEVSKCAFPRHAVVLYEDDVPVASINVCFSCGDIVLWPHWESKPDWSKMTDKQMKEHEAKQAKQMKLYDRTFPKWKSFFQSDVGFVIDPSFH